MTYTEAKQKALKINPKFDQVLASDNYWVFYQKESMRDDNSVAIERKTGKLWAFVEVMFSIPDGLVPKSI